jgi:mRNA interferase RelE/StbE
MENPRLYGYIKLKGEEAYRIRVKNYRIIYEINDETVVVTVISVGHRKEIY